MIKKKPKKTPFSFKKFILNLKAPKPIFIIILFLALIVSYAGLIYLAVGQIKPSLVNRKSDDVIVQEEETVSELDKKLIEMTNEVTKYTKTLKEVNENSRKYDPPVIDLDINF